jgi:predicted dehydrogenase
VSDSIRYGVIGTGMMGVEHINNILHLDGAVVTAVADPVSASLDWAQLAVGLETPLARFADHRALLDAGVCDAVVVATPNVTHVDVLLDVLDAGPHVLVEKPLCTTVADCRRVIERAADRPDRCVWMGLEYRYMPPTMRLLETVRSGVLGDVRMVSIREHRFPFLPKVGNWNRFNRNTGGTLVEKCCHFFDLMRLVAGADPTRVFASGGHDVNHLDEMYEAGVPDMLDNAYVVVDFANGVRGALDLSMFAEGGRYEQELCVVGDLGKLEATVPGESVWLGLRHEPGQREIPAPLSPEVTYEGFHHGSSQLEHLRFIECACVAGARLS